MSYARTLALTRCLGGLIREHRIGVRFFHFSRRAYQEGEGERDEHGKKKYQFIKDANAECPRTSRVQAEVSSTVEKRANFAVLGAITALFIGVGYGAYTHPEEVQDWIKKWKKVDDELIPELTPKPEKVVKLDRKLYQVTNPNSSEVPGVYITGNNEHEIISSNKKKVPRQLVFKRLNVFDNVVARDVYLGKHSGVLIDDSGDLYQWGEGFGGKPGTCTVKGEDLVKAAISNEAVYALTKRGEVLYFPEAVEAQKYCKGSRKGWFGSNVATNYKKLDTTKPIEDIQCGKEHIVLLTEDSQVYTAATGFNKPLEKSWGQFGLPNLSQFDPPPRNNELHDVALLNKFVDNGHIEKRHITQIAAGDYFSLCLDSVGRVWAFGRNTYGPIGREMNYNTEVIPYPSEVKLVSQHFKRDELPRCTHIAAGGETAYATFVSSNMYSIFQKSMKEEGKFDMKEVADSAENRTVHMAWGHGLKGELGSGRYTHGQYEPSKIKTLNNIQQYDEEKQSVVTLGIKSWSTGGNHSAVTLDNDDVYMWGDNEYGQLGNGKRSRVPTPAATPSLLEPDGAQTRTETELANDRLQLKGSAKFEQVVVAGGGHQRNLLP